MVLVIGRAASCCSQRCETTDQKLNGVNLSMLHILFARGGGEETKTKARHTALSFIGKHPSGTRNSTGVSTPTSSSIHARLLQGEGEARVAERLAREVAAPPCGRLEQDLGLRNATGVRVRSCRTRGLPCGLALA